jgi:hypothetical protein
MTPFALVLHLHQHQSSRNLHLQYLAKNQYTTLSITHHTRKRPSTVPRTTHGYMLETFVVLFPLIPLPNPCENGLNCAVFVVLEFGVFLAEILQFLLIQRVLVDHNLAMECP